MKVLSLFDGISCGMLALKRAGVDVERYAAYEIDKDAVKISKRNFPEIEHKGNVINADFSQYRGFDLLIGGSPCQSLSLVRSKTREHLDGKSKLFYEYVRALQEVQPKYFLFENVASMNEQSKNIISDILCCDPLLIDSANFSAQERPRYYWTNIYVDKRNMPRKNIVLKDILEDNVDEKYFYNAPFSDVNTNRQICAKLHINIHDMHKRVFNPNFKVHTLTACTGGQQQKKVLQNGRVRKLTPIEYERLQNLPDNYTAGVSNGARYDCCGNGWTVDVIAYIFNGIYKEPVATYKQVSIFDLLGEN